MTNAPATVAPVTNCLTIPTPAPAITERVAWGGCKRLEPCFSGSGAPGLPGDLVVPSRFVRLAFLREHAAGSRAGTKRRGCPFCSRLLHSAAFPLGAVELTGAGG